MMHLLRKLARSSTAATAAAGMGLAVSLAAPFAANADEADAKRILKAMSDYMTAEQVISFGFDTSLEFVTADHQKLQLASSGTDIDELPSHITIGGAQ